MQTLARPSTRIFFVATCFALAGMTLGVLSTEAHAASKIEKQKAKAGSTEIKAPDLLYYAMERDTLMSIAKQFTDKTSNWESLGKRNHINNDRAIPIGTAILIPAELLAEEASQVRVVALAGNVTEIKKTGNESGNTTALSVGSIVLEGSQVSTSKNGFVTFALPDESRISIPSNSQVTFAKLKATKFTKSPRTEIKLVQGRVESTVSSLQSNKGRFEVTSKLAVAGVRGTHFRVGINDNGIANEVLEGGVAVGRLQKPNELVLPAGQGSIVSQNGVSKPVNLLPVPSLVDNFQLQERPTLQFTVKPIDKAIAYHAQISKDGAAQNIVAEGMANDFRFKFDGLPDDDYFIRVTAIDANQLEGIPRTFAFKLKARPEPPFPLQPKNKVRTEAVEFKWTETSDAKFYRLQVAKDAQFSDIVLDQDQIRAAEWATSSLAIGDYYWRIASVIEKTTGKDQGPYSTPQSFSKKPGQSLNEVVDTGGNQMNFSWPSEPGQRFLVEISQQSDFKTLYLSKETSEANLNIARPDSGVYYIRVRATDADNFVGAFSKPQKFDIQLRWTSSNGEPINSLSGVVRPNKQ